MGLFQPVTKRGIFLHIIASRNTVPPKILRIVPFGDFHIFFNLNSSTRASSGVMVAIAFMNVILKQISIKNNLNCSCEYTTVNELLFYIPHFMPTLYFLIASAQSIVT